MQPGTEQTAESCAVAAFLESSEIRPSVLVIEGEAGIGKTSLWSATAEQARERGFQVLSALAGAAESGMAYGALADLLDSVRPEELASLPHVQRVAIDRVMSRDEQTGPATDERVVASAFLSLADKLSSGAPLLVAIDDVQWLDPSSRAVVAFAARRLKGRIGVVVTERTDAAAGHGAAWLQLNRLDGVERVHVSPLSLGALREMISTRLGRTFPRPTTVRIHEISGGNPFYALELARSMGDRSTGLETDLPGSLSDLVRARLDQLGDETLTVLLAAACVGTPTVDALAEASDQTTERVVELLEVAESDGIVQIDGNRVRFSHPLLARGVYSVVGPVRRRHMHRTLAEIVVQPELRARHLALAASSAEPSTQLALDTAADSAWARGAPAAAAELLDLAINLGGDTPKRRIRCAEHHFRAGESERADKLLKSTVDELAPGPLRASALNLLAAIRIYDDSLLEAIDLLDGALNDADGDHVLMVRSLLLSSFAYTYCGKADDSVRQAQQALEHADGLSMPGPTSQVLAMLVLAKCLRGDGVDEQSLQRALDLEDLEDDVPIQFRASAVRVFTDAWTGKLEEARIGTIDIKRLYLERGAENDVMSIAASSALSEVWRGDFAAAEAVAEEAMERAEHIDTQHIRGVALAMRATVAAHLGGAADARSDANAALAIALECGTPQLALRAMTILGFVDVSMANYEDAQKVLQPLVDAFDTLPGAEIRNKDYAPDAIEALINVGHIAASEPLIEKLEADGQRLDRPWLLAVGARCRAMWWAAKGDLDEAMRTVTRAMAEHDRLQMPFDRARTLLLLGQLQRRKRLKQAAAETFAEALREFDRMGASLWAARARNEIDRTNVDPARGSVLTPPEQRVADLVSSGMTNRDVAAELFVSQKTVEANLTQIYRKLGLRSRAQLARKLSETNMHGE
jgi:DNA-binding CsgD family transcriptional regulator